MGTRSHGQSKATSGSAALQNTLQPPSFNQPAPAESVPTLEDMHVQLEHTQRGGHHLSNFAASQPEPPPPNIQAKLTIGAPGDKYEQEADRVAQRVVQQIKVPKFDRPQSGQVVQQEPIAKHHDLQLKPILQREDGQEEDELQRSMYPGEQLLTTNEFQGMPRFHPEAPRKTHDLQLKPMPPAERLAKASTAASQWAAQLADTMVQPQIESLSVGDRPHITDLQMKPLPAVLQREAIDEEEGLQMKPTRSRSVAVSDVQLHLPVTEPNQVEVKEPEQLLSSDKAQEGNVVRIHVEGGNRTSETKNFAEREKPMGEKVNELIEYSRKEEKLTNALVACYRSLDAVTEYLKASQYKAGGLELASGLLEAGGYVLAVLTSGVGAGLAGPVVSRLANIPSAAISSGVASAKVAVQGITVLSPSIGGSVTNTLVTKVADSSVTRPTKPVVDCLEADEINQLAETVQPVRNMFELIKQSWAKLKVEYRALKARGQELTEEECYLKLTAEIGDAVLRNLPLLSTVRKFIHGLYILLRSESGYDAERLEIYQRSADMVSQITDAITSQGIEQLAERYAIQRRSAFGQEAASYEHSGRKLPFNTKRMTFTEVWKKFKSKAGIMNSAGDALRSQMEVAAAQEKANDQKIAELIEASADVFQRTPRILPMPNFQMKSAQSRGIGVGDASTDLESTITSARGSGQPLDPGLQRQMGQAMGADFRGVTVHTDATADRLNQSIQAKAFTTGKDIFFRSGAYNPGSLEGQELIAHELTHVVQQKGWGEKQHIGGFGEESWKRSKMSDLQTKTLSAPQWRVINSEKLGSKRNEIQIGRAPDSLIQAQWHFIFKPVLRAVGHVASEHVEPAVQKVADWAEKKALDVFRNKVKEEVTRALNSEALKLHFKQVKNVKVAQNIAEELCTPLIEHIIATAPEYIQSIINWIPSLGLKIPETGFTDLIHSLRDALTPEWITPIRQLISRILTSYIVNSVREIAENKLLQYGMEIARSTFREKIVEQGKEVANTINTGRRLVGAGQVVSGVGKVISRPGISKKMEGIDKAVRGLKTILKSDHGGHQLVKKAVGEGEEAIREAIQQKASEVQADANQLSAHIMMMLRAMQAFSDAQREDEQFIRVATPVFSALAALNLAPIALTFLGISSGPLILIPAGMAAAQGVSYLMSSETAKQVGRELDNLGQQIYDNTSMIPIIGRNVRSTWRTINTGFDLISAGLHGLAGVLSHDEWVKYKLALEQADRHAIEAYETGPLGFLSDVAKGIVLGLTGEENSQNILNRVLYARDAKEYVKAIGDSDTEESEPESDVEENEIRSNTIEVDIDLTEAFTEYLKSISTRETSSSRHETEENGEWEGWEPLEQSTMETSNSRHETEENIAWKRLNHVKTHRERKRARKQYIHSGHS
jgi:hypothetical protein